jgi:periplasmic copper chaperone A
MALVLILYSLLSQQDRKCRRMSHTDKRHWFSCGKTPLGLVLLVISGILSAGVRATADEHGLELSGAYMQTTIPSVPAAGYFTLKNNGDVDRVLVEASSPACESIMMHKSESVGGVEKMRMVDSIPVPAHQSVTFAPGGFHLMCMSPAESMKPGISVPATLTFEGGISLTSDFPVRSAEGK